MRSRISPAALFVKVMARIAVGSTPLLADEAGHAVGQDPGLAAPGAGEHEQRPGPVEDGLALRWVEAVQEVRHHRNPIPGV